MNLAIIKHPTPLTVSRCRELGDATGPLDEGEELMTLADYNAWLKAPEQLEKLEAIEAIAEANRQAEHAQVLAEEEDKIAQHMALFNYNRAQSIYVLTDSGKIVHTKE